MAKKLTTEDLVLNIIVNSNPAQSEIGKLSRTIADNKLKVKEAEQELKKLAKQLGTDSAEYRKLKAEVASYNSVITESKRRLGELNQSLRLQDMSLKQLEASLRRTRQLWREATNDVARQKYAAEMKLLNQRIGELKGGTDQASSALSNYIGKYKGWAAAVAAVVSAAKRSFDTNLRFESISQGLRAASGDAESFQKNLEFLREVSHKLGLEFYNTAGAFKMWQGAVRYSNLTAEQSRDIFESVANAAAQLKMSNQDLEGVFLALSQMMSKGKVQAEELRNQLGERLPGALSIAAKAMGKTERELNKMLEKGEIIAEDFLPRFAEELKKTYGDGSQKIEGMQAAVNRLSNEFEELFQSERASRFFTVVLDGFARMTRDIRLMINSKSWGELKAVLFYGHEGHAKYMESQKPAHLQAVSGFDKLTKAQQDEQIKQMQANIKSRADEYNANRNEENFERLKLANQVLAEMYKIYYAQHKAIKKLDEVSEEDAEKARQKAEQARRKAYRKELEDAEKHFQKRLQQESLFREDLSELTEDELLLLAEIEKDYQTKLDNIHKKYGENLKTISMTAEQELKRRAQAEKKYIDSLLISKQTEVEAEQAAYEDRLKKAGLFGKNREQLTERQLRALEILEKQHQENIAKIDSEAIAKEIDTRINAHKEILAELRIRHADELAEIRTLEQAKAYLAKSMTEEELARIKTLGQARRLILNQQQLEEQALLKERLNQLLETLRRATATGQFEGLNLADSILSEQEKKVLEDRIRQIREELARIKGIDLANEIRESDPRNHVDVLGMSVADWENLFANIGTTHEKLMGLYGVIDAMTQVWNQYNQLVANKENQQLQRDEVANKKKKQNLQQRLDQGLMSQEEYNKRVEKLDAEMDKKRATIARNQAKRDRNVALMSAVVNTARAVTQVLPNLVLAAIVGAFGALQIGTIASTPLPEIPGAEQGGQFLEVTRAQDGKRFRAKVDPDKRGYVANPTVLVGENGTEWVANAEAVANPAVRPILDILDTAQKNGTISTINLSDIIAATMGAPKVSGRKSGGYVGDDTSSSPAHFQAFNELVTVVRRLDDKLSNLHAKVYLLGKGGFIEAMDEYNKIQNNSNL